MEFANPLTQGVLLKRYKRYLVEIIINNQEHRTIYCSHKGAMTGCDTLGSRIWFSHESEHERSLPDILELVEVDAGHLVCVNTQKTVPLLMEGIENGIVEELQGYTVIDSTSPILDDHEFDLALDDNCFVNINSVTLGDEIHRGFFPDAKMEKAVQQLNALIHAKSLGHRAVLIYCVQHTGIDRIFPADHIDSQYGSCLRQALIAGVEIYAYKVDITLDQMHVNKPVEVRIPARMICSSRT